MQTWLFMCLLQLLAGLTACVYYSIVCCPASSSSSLWPLRSRNNMSWLCNATYHSRATTVIVNSQL